MAVVTEQLGHTRHRLRGIWLAVERRGGNHAGRGAFAPRACGLTRS